MTGKTNILVVYTAMIPTTQSMMNIMHEVVRITGNRLRGKNSIKINTKDIIWADVILFIRGADPYMEKIAEVAYTSGRYCLMYLDDDLLNIPSDGVETYKNALKGCLHWCHLLWASNPNILKKYSRYMQNPVCVEEKAFDPIDMMLPINEETENIRIVYAGSASHAPNLQEYIIPALNYVCQKYQNVDVTFIGLQKGDLKDVRFNVTYIPWFYNLKEYKKFIAENRYHIGLAVVKDEEFYRCKYYNKFIEYSKMGVLGIYSDCEPYQFIVRDHENGLMSKNSISAWSKNIEEAVKNDTLRRECVINAQNLLKEEFDTEKILNQLIEKIPEFQNYNKIKSYKVTYNEISLYTRFFNFLGNTRFGYWLWGKALKIWHAIK